MSFSQRMAMVTMKNTHEQKWNAVSGQGLLFITEYQKVLNGNVVVIFGVDIEMKEMICRKP